MANKYTSTFPNNAMPRFSSKRIVALLSVGIFFVLLLACKHEEIPPLRITALDPYLFPKDTLFSHQHLEAMAKAHPQVSQDFFYYILGIDSSSLLTDPINTQRIAYFSQHHRIIKDTLLALHLDWENELHELAQMEKKYRDLLSPSFLAPPLYSYTAPVDAPAIASFSSWMGINLTLFAGKDFPLYRTYEFQSIFPSYLQHRLDKRYFPYFVMKQLLLDEYPLQEHTHSLIEQMINAGKYMYVLEQLSSDKKDDRISMFTPSQLAWCEDNEEKIFTHIKTTVADLYTTAPDIIRNFIGEAPKTQGMPDEAPGNLGAWVGWQIVQSFMNKKSITLAELLKTNPYQVFQQSDYKP